MSEHQTTAGTAASVEPAVALGPMDGSGGAGQQPQAPSSDVAVPADATTHAEAAAPTDATPHADAAAHPDAGSPANGDPGPPEPEPAPPSADDLRPAEIVRRLDAYIIGQAEAKRAVAIALRNRVRRQRLSDDMRDEVLPKNILMIGPTGVGKTEIARRLARMTNSPFIKVEATKFTEVGYVGRDVESIVRDLLEQTITDIQNERVADVEDRARELAEQRIVEVLLDAEEKSPRAARASAAAAQGGPAPDGQSVSPDAAGVAGPAGAAADAAGSTGASAGSAGAADKPAPLADEDEEQRRRRRRLRRRQLERKLAAKQLEEREIEVEVEEPYQPVIEAFSGTGMEEIGYSLSDFFSQMAPPRKRLRRMTVADARTALAQEETDRLVDMDRVYDDAIKSVEDDAIVFIDEVDKIAGTGSEHGPDVSGEGVQRDLLPVLEGSTVHTRYGAVRTDHILFVAAGAFNVAKPSDLIPEFQGRFPIRVELKPLSEEDLQRILVEPGNALTKQYAALLGTETVTLDFTDDGLRELAHQAAMVNDQDENIGARRLFTIMEKVLEEISFSAEEHAGQTVRVDAAYVRARLADLVRNEDLRRYVL
jgi:ATP-dependent HslUV protease ATP-binding subunit HslU